MSYERRVIVEGDDEQGFGFSVTWTSDGKDWEGYTVELPHQCDSWGVTGPWGEPVTKAGAVERLSAFIAEASSALEALKAAADPPVAQEGTPT